jgi:hypothetical protein
MGGNTIFELDELSQPINFCFSITLNVGLGVRTANGSTKGNQDHFFERMVCAAIDSGVCNIFKMIVSSFQERLSHDHIPSLALRKLPQSKFGGIVEGASYAIIGPKPINVQLP